MKASIIREMDSSDLIEAIAEKEMSLTKMKIGHKVAEIENPIEIRKTRRTVARMKTELRRRELEKAGK
ncbi:MAG: 50S ribosomal protein L29 [Flavobacteriales bacterium]|nr:50S ribosomal protein L29 [Flavobacteriales bacterium]MCB9198218.1 50S ribosomal protein L29 [Flavobacteriales bacterium]